MVLPDETNSEELDTPESLDAEPRRQRMSEQVTEPGIDVLIDRTYRLHQQLGAGGMGAVFRATHVISGQEVALKLVAGADAGQRLRLALAREFQTLSSLHHPNIVQVKNYGFDETRGPYIAMELLPSPQTILEAAQQQPVETKIGLIAQLLRALAFVHRRGILHRDLKPSNVLVVEGEIKLLDFGVAVRVTDGAGIAGTLAYIAPEILANRPPSPASDLYSLGIIFFQMLTEQFPYSMDSITRMYNELVGDEQDETMAQTVARFLDSYRSPQRTTNESIPVAGDTAELHTQPEGAVVPPGDDLGGKIDSMLIDAGDLSPEVARIVKRLLARHPSERFAAASDVITALAKGVSFPLPVETSATRESFLQAAMLIGRDDELAQLSKRLEEAAARQGGSLLLSGENGVGKSRLLAELRTQALTRGFWVAQGQSSQESGSHYHEFLPLLRALCFRVEPSDDEASVLQDLVPELGSLLDRVVASAPRLAPEPALSRLCGVLLALLSRLTKPLLFVLEDLQWARSESLTLFAQLAPRLCSLPVLLIASCRSDEPLQFPEALRDVPKMSLSRLLPAHVATLSASMLGCATLTPEAARVLYQHTEGNVFFLIEILRALSEDANALALLGKGQLPEQLRSAGIERMVEWRVVRISELHRPLLELAATLGRTLDLPLLERAASDGALRDFLFLATSAAVLEREGELWRFSHEKLRESILSRLPAARRKALHQQAAELLCSHKDESARIASHFEQAEQYEPALSHYLQASDHATHLSLYREARVHLQAAERMLAALPETTVRQRTEIDLCLKQMQTSLLTDKLDVQLQRAARIRELFASIVEKEGAGSDSADQLRQARLDYFLGRAHEYAGQPIAAIGCYKRVLPIARAVGDEELIVMPSYVIGSALSMQGELKQACDLLSEALEPMQRIATPFEALRCMLYYSLALSACGRYKEALPHAEKARAAALRIGHPSIVALACSLRGGTNRILADWTAMLEAGQETVKAARQVGDKVFLFLGLCEMAWSHAYLGRMDLADREREEGLQIMAEAGGRLIATDWFVGAQGEMALLRRDNEAALAIAEELLRQSRAAGLVVSLGMAERIIAVARGRLGAASAELDERFERAEQIFLRSGNVLDIAQTRLWRGRSARERGAATEAAQHFKAALDCFAEQSSPAAFKEAKRFAEES